MPVFEKQKIKMPKMAAVAAIFDILIFCFSRRGTPPKIINALGVGHGVMHWGGWGLMHWGLNALSALPQDPPPVH